MREPDIGDCYYGSVTEIKDCRKKEACCIFYLVSSMADRDTTYDHALFGGPLRMSFTDDQVSAEAVTCPFLYLPKRIPSSTYLSVSDTHIGNCPVETAVCPFNMPV